jgi:response regulator of citrate/malate metabolism
MHLEQEVTIPGRKRRTESQPTKVLLVEDEVLIALELQNALEACNCEIVGPASSMREAAALLKSSQVDAALVDLYLTDGISEPLLELLKSKAIPFALCTGADPREIMRRYPRVLVMRKPYIFDHACEVVDKLIERG